MESTKITADEYQLFCIARHKSLASPAEELKFGIDYVAGESGELLNLINKVWWQDHPLDPALCDKLILELGDVLWGITVTANALGVRLEEVMARNHAKLRRRYPDGHFTPADSIARVDTDGDDPAT